MIEAVYYGPEICGEAASRDRVGATAEAELDAINGMIDSMTKTVVFLSLQAETLWKIG